MLCPVLIILFIDRYFPYGYFVIVFVEDLAVKLSLSLSSLKLLSMNSWSVASTFIIYNFRRFIVCYCYGEQKVLNVYCRLTREDLLPQHNYPNYSCGGYSKTYHDNIPKIFCVTVLNRASQIQSIVLQTCFKQVPGASLPDINCCH